MTHSSLDRSRLCISTRSLAALALLGCTLSATAQVTFDFQQELVGQNSNDLFGWSLDLSGDGYTVIIGAIDNDGAAVGGQPAGHARVYKNTYNAQFNSWSWGQVGADIDGTNQDEEAGYSVAVTTNGNTVAVGSPEQGQDTRLRSQRPEQLGAARQRLQHLHQRGPATRRTRGELER
jgi:hypothetical protein